MSTRSEDFGLQLDRYKQAVARLDIATGEDARREAFAECAREWELLSAMLPPRRE
jgi:hypothetical protein